MQMERRKRKEMEKGKSELRMTMEELSFFISRPREKEVQLQQEKQNSSTIGLLCLSKQLLRVLEEVGPTLLVLRQDIHQNVQRLQDLHSRDPSKYASLKAIVTEEAEQGTSKKTSSCTRAILWLSRSIKFSKCLLEKLLQTPAADQSTTTLEKAVQEAYKCTLQQWHGWISSAAYKVALKLVPERDVFVALLMGSCPSLEDLEEDAKVLIRVVQPILEEIDAVLAEHKLDKLKSS